MRGRVLGGSLRMAVLLAVREGALVGLERELRISNVCQSKGQSTKTVYCEQRSVKVLVYT